MKCGFQPAFPVEAGSRVAPLGQPGPGLSHSQVAPLTNERTSKLKLGLSDDHIQSVWFSMDTMLHPGDPSPVTTIPWPSAHTP